MFNIVSYYDDVYCHHFMVLEQVPAADEKNDVDELVKSLLKNSVSESAAESKTIPDTFIPTPSEPIAKSTRYVQRDIVWNMSVSCVFNDTATQPSQRISL